MTFCGVSETPETLSTLAELNARVRQRTPPTDMPIVVYLRYVKAVDTSRKGHTNPTNTLLNKQTTELNRLFNSDLKHLIPDDDRFLDTDGSNYARLGSGTPYIRFEVLAPVTYAPKRSYFAPEQIVSDYTRDVGPLDRFVIYVFIISIPTSESFSGKALFPSAQGAGAALILDHQALGDHFTSGVLKQGSILAHEIGHCMGLSHPFYSTYGGEAACQSATVENLFTKHYSHYTRQKTANAPGQKINGKYVDNVELDIGHFTGGRRGGLTNSQFNALYYGNNRQYKSPRSCAGEIGSTKTVQEAFMNGNYRHEVFTNVMDYTGDQMVSWDRLNVSTMRSYAYSNMLAYLTVPREEAEAHWNTGPSRVDMELWLIKRMGNTVPEDFTRNSTGSDPLPDGSAEESAGSGFAFYWIIVIVAAVLVLGVIIYFAVRNATGKSLRSYGSS